MTLMPHGMFIHTDKQVVKKANSRVQITRVHARTRVVLLCMTATYSAVLSERKSMRERATKLGSPDQSQCFRIFSMESQAAWQVVQGLGFTPAAKRREEARRDTLINNHESLRARRVQVAKIAHGLPWSADQRNIRPQGIARSCHAVVDERVD